MYSFGAPMPFIVVAIAHKWKDVWIRGQFFSGKLQTFNRFSSPILYGPRWALLCSFRMTPVDPPSYFLLWIIRALPLVHLSFYGLSRLQSIADPILDKCKCCCWAWKFEIALHFLNAVLYWFHPKQRCHYAEKTSCAWTSRRTFHCQIVWNLSIYQPNPTQSCGGLPNTAILSLAL